MTTPLEAARVVLPKDVSSSLSDEVLGKVVEAVRDQLIHGTSEPTPDLFDYGWQFNPPIGEGRGSYGVDWHSARRQLLDDIVGGFLEADMTPVDLSMTKTVLIEAVPGSEMRSNESGYTFWIRHSNSHPKRSALSEIA